LLKLCTSYKKNGSQNIEFLKLLKLTTVYCTAIINSQLNDQTLCHAQISFIAIRNLNIPCQSHYNNGTENQILITVAQVITLRHNSHTSDSGTILHFESQFRPRRQNQYATAYV
jgi:hypothetical protein